MLALCGHSQTRHLLMFVACCVVRLMRLLSLRNPVYVPCKERLASSNALMLTLR